MKNFCIALVVCLLIAYALDAYFFGGQYFQAVTRMLSDMAQHF